MGGYGMAPAHLDPAVLAWMAVGTGLCSAAANTFNQVSADRTHFHSNHSKQLIWKAPDWHCYGHSGNGLHMCLGKGEKEGRKPLELAYGCYFTPVKYQVPTISWKNFTTYYEYCTVWVLLYSVSEVALVSC